MRVEGKPELLEMVTADAIFNMICKNIWDKEKNKVRRLNRALCSLASTRKLISRRGQSVRSELVDSGQVDYGATRIQTSNFSYTEPNTLIF